MIDLTVALKHVRPNDSWSLNGDNYSGLMWLSDTPKPTEQEITEAYPDAVKAIAANKKARLKSLADARAFALSLGFTEAMLAVMYPQLTKGA